MTASVTPCCSVTFYSDPVSVVGSKPSKIRLGDVARCSGCHRIYGEVRFDRYPAKPLVDGVETDLAGLQRKFSGTTFSMLVDLAIAAKGGPTPLNVRLDSSGLVPENYVKPKLAIEHEEPPF